jgi:hypothetical protein
MLVCAKYGTNLVCAKYGTNPTLVETQDQHFLGGEQQNREKCGMGVKGRNNFFFLKVYRGGWMTLSKA